MLSPVVFRVLKSILEEAGRAGVPVSLCGEMAGRPLDAMALIGLGFRTLSLAPPSLGAIKAMLRTVHVGGLQEFVEFAVPRRAKKRARPFAVFCAGPPRADLTRQGLCRLHRHPQMPKIPLDFVVADVQR